MIFVTVPAEDGLAAFIGLTADDMMRFVAGSQPDALDMRYLFDEGMPLPSAIQLVYSPTVEGFWEKLTELFPELEFEQKDRLA